MNKEVCNEISGIHHYFTELGYSSENASILTLATVIKKSKLVI